VQRLEDYFGKMFEIEVLRILHLRMTKRPNMMNEQYQKETCEKESQKFEGRVLTLLNCTSFIIEAPEQGQRCW
jgi:hypothetical protein